MNDIDKETNTYIDNEGRERDVITNKPRFTTTNIYGDRVTYDEKHKIIRNYSEEKRNNLESKYRMTGEHTVIPMDKNKHLEHKYSGRRYKDIKTGQLYILISPNRDCFNSYYQSIITGKIVRPSDATIKSIEEYREYCIKNYGNELNSEEVIKKSWEKKNEYIKRFNNADSDDLIKQNIYKLDDDNDF